MVISPKQQTLFLPTDPPERPTVTVFVEPEGGLRGILDCRVDSEPLASLTLHHRSRLVASSQPQGAPAESHIHVSASPNALRVDMEVLRPSDQGEYVCSASNALGSASASAYFGVSGEGKASISQPLCCFPPIPSTTVQPVWPKPASWSSPRGEC